jgi:hypothetical protein
MPDNKNTQKDAGVAAENRPTPSQAEGEETPPKSLPDRPRPSQAEGEDKRRP